MPDRKIHHLIIPGCGNSGATVTPCRWLQVKASYKKLPGRPDIVMPIYKTVIFV